MDAVSNSTSRYQFWRVWFVGMAFIVAVALTIMFMVRAARHVPPLRTGVDEPIHRWMTVPYVAHSYHVPPHALFQALGLPAGPPDKRTIAQIAAAQGRSVDDVKATLVEAIIHARPPYPAPPPPSEPRSAP